MLANAVAIGSFDWNRTHDTHLSSNVDGRFFQRIFLHFRFATNCHGLRQSFFNPQKAMGQDKCDYTFCSILRTPIEQFGPAGEEEGFPRPMRVISNLKERHYIRTERIVEYISLKSTRGGFYTPVALR